LYEMLTGHLPFGGKSASHTIVSILDEEPPPLARFLPDVPEALQEVVTDALTKDPEARFQTAKQFHAKLQRLKGRLQTGAHLDHSVAPNLTNASGQALNWTGASGEGANAQPTVGVSHQTTARSGEAAATTQTVSSAEYAVKQLTGHKKIALLGLALLAVSVAAVAFAIYKFAGRGEPKAPAGQMKIARLTTTGQASDADISPDGKYVVHVKSENGRQSLWLRQIETTSDTQVVPPTDDVFAGITFSRDGAYIYYLRGQPNIAASLYQVPLLGGAARKLSDNVSNRVTLSPDGKRMAFRRVRSPGETLIVVANSDGTGERVLAVRKLPNTFSAGGPSWSPDGKSIASGVLNVDEGGNYGTLVEVEVEGGTERRLTPERWSTVGQVSWLPDKSGLVFTATAEGTVASQIWHVSYPGGEVRRVTNDLNSYTRVSLTADASALVTVQREGETNVWVGPAGETARARQITSGRAFSGGAGLSWTPDGRIVYTAQEGGVSHTWIMEADGTGARQLTSRTRSNNQPSVTADGRYIVFRSIRTGTWTIWRMDMDGGNVKQLTEGGTDNWPRPSPDGRWVIFTSNRAGVQNLWKVSIDGGEPVRLTEKNTYNATVSPDGKLIACHYREEANVPYRVALIPFEGGDPVKLLDFSQKFAGPPGLRWTQDGRAL
ncbi:MAG: DPP IV N-terminal domain-containing protein, partial [Acidobacteria bacterium]|nr:DPP IV N-terminal domain-containing protein [Acidobacteriota bacterium]